MTDFPWSLYLTASEYSKWGIDNAFLASKTGELPINFLLESLSGGQLLLNFPALQISTLQILYNSVVYFIVTGFCYEGVNQYPERRFNFY
jgi:hypothetical protein